MADITSYTLSDLTTVGQLKRLAERVHSTYATNTDLTTELAKKVDIDILESELTEALNGKASTTHTHTTADITDMPTELSRFDNDSNFITEEEVNAKISSVYKPAGSIGFSDLASKKTKENLGNVYNVTDGFVTDVTFVEGQSASYPAGTNVVVVDVGDGDYKFDVLSGIVDLTPYVQTDDLTEYEKKSELDTKLKDYVKSSDLTTTLSTYVTNAQLTTTLVDYAKTADIESQYVTKDVLTTGLTAEFNTKADVGHTHSVATASEDGFMGRTDRVKLDSLTVATDEEVFDMLDDVFGLLSRASVMATSAHITDLGNKSVGDLIGDDVSIDADGKVTGTLKQCDGWTEFGGDGVKNHYLPLCLDDCYKNKPITVQGSGEPKTEIDTEWVLAVQDKDSTFNFKDGETELFTLSFSDAIFAGAEE